MQIVNPATEEVIADVSVDTTETMPGKIDRLRAAQPAWAARPLAERLAAIHAFRARVKSEVDSLALTLTREMGKPIGQAKGEINALVADGGRVDFFLRETERALAPEEVMRDGKLVETITHEPLGVVANISAWNYPWFVGSNAFVPALLAGNAVAYKPSEHATMTGLHIAALLHASGVPEDVFVPFVGAGDVGRGLLDPALKIDGVFFTGSYGTGRQIAKALADRMVKLQLELGGKDPTYVMDDADPKAAAESLADGAMYNAGQSCCSVERIYVHEAIAHTFIEAFLATTRGFVVGDPEDPKTYLGPLARRAQIDILAEHVRDAVGRGAVLAMGGGRVDRKGYWFEPTVLLNVDHRMKVMREESFGPIIGIQVVRSDAEALELMNDTPYGLTAGVYGVDEARAKAILGRVNSGSVYFNCCDRVSPRLPWTGRGHSGIGTTLSTMGIRTFTQPKAWHSRSA